MRAEREFEAGAAITIALAIIPMNWLAYLSLSLILAGLIVRVLWISIPKRWERWAAVIGGVKTKLFDHFAIPQTVQRDGRDVRRRNCSSRAI